MFRGFFKKKTAQLAELVTTPEKSESESDICSICFEVWTSTGSHRYVFLRSRSKTVFSSFHYLFQSVLAQMWPFIRPFLRQNMAHQLASMS